MLAKYGYNTTASPCYLQCFDLSSIKYMSRKTPLRLLYLLEVRLSDAKLTEAAAFCHGVGAPKSAIIPVDLENHLKNSTDFVEKCHAAGLKVRAVKSRINYQVIEEHNK